MSSVNKVICLGHVGKDPEIRSFQNGGRIATFSVAMSEKWKDKATGEKKERTEWANIVVLNDPLITVVEQYIKKGSKVYIEGQYATRKWQAKDGTDRYSTEVVLRPYNGEIVLLDRKEGDGRPPAYEDQYAPSSKQSVSTNHASEPDTGYTGMDDDIPF